MTQRINISFFQQPENKFTALLDPELFKNCQASAINKTGFGVIFKKRKNWIGYSEFPSNLQFSYVLHLEFMMFKVKVSWILLLKNSNVVLKKATHGLD